MMIMSSVEKGFYPIQPHCRWYFPDLKLFPPKSETSESAPLEVLLDPRQIMKYEKAGLSHDGEGFVVYYDGPGETVEEFAYLIDSLFQFQLVRRDYRVLIRSVNGVSAALNNFE